LPAKLVPAIEAVMASDAKTTPLSGGDVYYDHELDLRKGQQVGFDAAIAEREAHYIVYLKAKILAKLGDRRAPSAAANAQGELAIQSQRTHT